jgi:hypothetical protein
LAYSDPRKLREYFGDEFTDKLPLAEIANDLSYFTNPRFGVRGSIPKIMKPVHREPINPETAHRIRTEGWPLMSALWPAMAAAGAGGYAASGRRE